MPPPPTAAHAASVAIVPQFPGANCDVAKCQGCINMFCDSSDKDLPECARDQCRPVDRGYWGGPNQAPCFKCDFRPSTPIDPTGAEARDTPSLIPVGAAATTTTVASTSGAAAAAPRAGGISSDNCNRFALGQCNDACKKDFDHPPYTYRDVKICTHACSQNYGQCDGEDQGSEYDAAVGGLVQ